MELTESRVPALVLGEGNSALGALRALGRRGVRCHVAPAATDFVRRSRWYAAWPGRSSPQLSSLLDSAGGETAILVPCSDPWVLAVSGLPPSLATRFPSSVPPRAALETLVNKGAFADLLARQGIPHPRTVRLRAASDVRGLPAELLGRAFLKPADSHAFQQRFERKAFRFTSVAEAETLAAEALSAGLEVMVQEYVPGPPSAHYFLDGFVDRHGRLSACFARQRLRMWPPDFGNSSAMVSVPLAEVAPAHASIEALLSVVRYRGIFSAEFKRDPRDGLFRILEVNARAWKFVDFAAGCGVDVSHMAYKDALGLPVDPVLSYKVGATCVDAYFDRPACAALHRRGELSLAEWARFWLRARPVTFAWDDPLPGLAWILDRLLSLRRRSPEGER